MIQQPMMIPQPMMIQQPMMIEPSTMMQEVSLVLPPELQPPPITLIPSSVTPTVSPSFSLDTTEQTQFQPQPKPMTETTMSSINESFDSNKNGQTNKNEVSNQFTFKDVPYGCLRNGNKPTYRTYHRNQNSHVKNNHNTTLKKPLFEQTSMNIVSQDVDPMIQERQRKLREIQANNNNMRMEQNTVNASVQPDTTNQNLNIGGADNSVHTPQPSKIKKEIRQTITKKYKLGKQPNGNVVGVLVKNSDTRRRVQEEHGILQRESIIEIRKYLHDHGLIKVGSDAPPDVLRNIYESAKLTGEVNNTNKHIMLYNFMKSDENTTSV